MPALQTVFFHTFGCKVNQYETESMRQKLAQIGYEVTEDFAQSDLCVINSCSVTAEADKKCRQFIRRVLRANEKARVLVTGCYATRSPEDVRRVSPRIEVFSNQEKDSLPEIVAGCSLFSEHSAILTHFSGHTRAFVKVQDGCDATCTYCIIPKVRPDMQSRPMTEVLAEVRGLIEQGYKEIVLTGIRLGSYGLSSSGGRVGRVHGNLTHLLAELIRLPGQFRIRLSSLEITEVTSELLDMAAGSEKICRHFHLPLQSGDDAVLRRMGRWYGADFYAKKAEEIRRVLPDVGLTADVIVGFPGETEENFSNTVRLIEAHLNGLHVFPFSSRPGTPAAKLNAFCRPETVQERTQKLMAVDQDLRRSFQNRFAGQTRVVLAESDGGYTDNGIRLSGPLPFPEGVLQTMRVPAPL